MTCRIASGRSRNGVSSEKPCLAARAARSASYHAVLSRPVRAQGAMAPSARERSGSGRSEEHTSELQSRENLVCRLLLEKKKKAYQIAHGTGHCRYMVCALAT